MVGYIFPLSEAAFVCLICYGTAMMQNCGVRGIRIGVFHAFAAEIRVYRVCRERVRYPLSAALLFIFFWKRCLHSTQFTLQGLDILLPVEYIVLQCVDLLAVYAAVFGNTGLSQ